MRDASRASIRVRMYTRMRSWHFGVIAEARRFAVNTADSAGDTGALGCGGTTQCSWLRMRSPRGDYRGISTDAPSIASDVVVCSLWEVNLSAASDHLSTWRSHHLGQRKSARCSPIGHSYVQDVRCALTRIPRISHLSIPALSDPSRERVNLLDLHVEIRA
jgi:hypothetical protein